MKELRDVPRPQLMGGFIEYWNNMIFDPGRLTRDDWFDVLSAMSKARMNVIIVKRLVYRDSDAQEWRFFFPASSSDTNQFDPTRAILDHASQLGSRVYLGLYEDQNWVTGNYLSGIYIDELRDKSIALARVLWTEFGNHPAFAGWSIPIETWTSYPEDERDVVGHLNGLFREVTTECKKLAPGKDILMSPYLRSQDDPAKVTELYTNILQRTGVDYVVLQDGVGANNWDHEIATAVPPFFAAFGRACLATGATLWANVESYAMETSTLHSASLVRLEEQLAVESDFVTRFVTFDFFHFMFPRGKWSQAPLAERARLYSDYLKYVGQISEDVR